MEYGVGQGLTKENRQISGRDLTKYQGTRNLGFSLGERQALQLQSRPSVLQWGKNNPPPPRFQDLRHSELENPAALKAQVLCPGERVLGGERGLLLCAGAYWPCQLAQGRSFQTLKTEETLHVMLGNGQGKWPQSPGRKREGVPRGCDERQV